MVAVQTCLRTTTMHLIVHFDINETILVGDEAGGDTREDCLNKIVAKSAFVRIPAEFFSGSDSDEHSKPTTHDITPTHWWDGTPIQETYEHLGEDDQIPPLFFGWDWPEGCCPYYRTAFKSRSNSFLSHHGSIYKPVYESIVKSLNVRPLVKTLSPALSDILPAFFESLVALRSSRREDHTTTIVLRTFGTDLPEIAQAVSLFARGKHPDYPDMYDERLILEKDRLVKGRWIKNSAKSGDGIDHDDSGYDYQLWDQSDLVIASGDAQVLDFIHSQCGSICGIQDDYDHWDANNCQPWAGKPIWKINREQSSNDHFHHLLLDDNM